MVKEDIIGMLNMNIIIRPCYFAIAIISVHIWHTNIDYIPM